jgi:hypothetical protein
MPKDIDRIQQLEERVTNLENKILSESLEFLNELEKYYKEIGLKNLERYIRNKKKLLYIGG